MSSVDPGVKFTVEIYPQQKSNTCWYASIMMVLRCFDHNAEFDQPKEWINDEGVTVYQFKKIAEKAGIVQLDGWSTCYTSINIKALLKRHGPIIAAVEPPRASSAHAIVITGVYDGEGNEKNALLYYNDPGQINTSTGVRKGFSRSLTLEYMNREMPAKSFWGIDQRSGCLRVVPLWVMHSFGRT